jgi:hypothetical protein
MAASAAVVALALLAGPGSTEGAATPVLHAALRQLPPRMAWAWERPEDLRWLPPDTGVAYLATSIWLHGNAVALRPRAQPLWLHEGTVRLPVVHVDASTADPPALDAAQAQAVVQQVLLAAAGSPSRVVQLDFEARLSQRAFLTQVVRQARLALPADTALSMTALASWCAGDAWLDDVPADEVVPMAFRMSRDGPVLRARLARDGAFSRKRCRDAIGSATDEPLPGLVAPRHYVFSPRPWTAAAWQAHPFARPARPVAAWMPAVSHRANSP